MTRNIVRADALSALAQPARMSDSNTVAAEHYTFPPWCRRPKCEGPLHLHDDVEEVFFMLKALGRSRWMIQDGDTTPRDQLRERDLISSRGIYRGCLTTVRRSADAGCLGNAKPDIPDLSGRSSASKVKRKLRGMTGFREQGKGMPPTLLHRHQAWRGLLA